MFIKTCALTDNGFDRHESENYDEDESFQLVAYGRLIYDTTKKNY